MLGGPRILMKRDDQTGLGFGGNKTRKLEFLMGDAINSGCDSVITAGAAQSNHCRQTAAAAATCGVECHLALGGEPPDTVQGNLLLDHLFGAAIHWTGDRRKGEDIPALVESLKAKGKSPYVIPYGGSNKVGALGFVLAIAELQQQLTSAGEKVDHIVFASSSGGTHSGMMVGNSILGNRFNLVGINIDKDEVFGMSLADFILHLAEETAGHIQLTSSFPKKMLNLSDDYLGGGYGIVGDPEMEALSLVARLEGIVLDPVYTGRAMAGLFDMIRRGVFSKSETVLFWHTGGSPALFAYGETLQSMEV